jgi:hypothetical protein
MSNTNMHTISSKHLTFSLYARIEWSILLHAIEHLYCWNLRWQWRDIQKVDCWKYTVFQIQGSHSDSIRRPRPKKGSAQPSRLCYTLRNIDRKWDIHTIRWGSPPPTVGSHSRKSVSGSVSPFGGRVIAQWCQSPSFLLPVVWSWHFTPSTNHLPTPDNMTLSRVAHGT